MQGKRNGSIDREEIKSQCKGKRASIGHEAEKVSAEEIGVVDWTQQAKTDILRLT